MPPKKIPRANKQIAGTIRPDRDRPEPEFPASSGSEAPDWVKGDDALDEWKRLTELLSASRVLTEADLTALGHLVMLHGSCVQMYRANMQPQAAALTQLRLYLAEFGLSPASRSKASQIGSDSKKNKFNQLGGKKTG